MAATALAPAQQPSFSLALPTASAGPDPLAYHQGLYSNNSGASFSSSAAAAAAVDSDEDWDEILAQPDRAQPSHHGQQQQPAPTDTIEDETDDGLDFLERELLWEDEPMGDADADGDGDGEGDEEGDEDMEEMILSMLEEVAPTPRQGGGAAGPISMNQFVGGGVAVEDDDDEYSSSEESDED